MRSITPVIVAALFGACPSPDTAPEVVDSDTVADAHTDADTASDDPDTGAGAVDLDRDGVSPPEDCDDREPLAFPGAVEVWDGIDNDCDGRIDGRGAFVGEMELRASAIVEGQTQRRNVTCSVTLDRQTVILSFDVRCDVPSTDALARQLLGETLTITPQDNVAVEGAWTGQTVVASTDGWQASGTGSAQWTTDLDGLQLSIDLDSASLRLAGTTLLTRSPPD